MSKKQKANSKKAQPKNKKQIKEQQKTVKPTICQTQKNHRLIFLIIVVVSVVLYANTFTHDYALDDTLVILENSFTTQGISGIKDIFSYDTFQGFFGVEKKLVAGGRYRPLSVATFALEYEFFGLTPGVSHIINVLLYALCGIFIYLVLDRMFGHILFFSDQKINQFLTIPVLSTFIFIAHPIHTEVVANIKGRDEIMTLLFSILTLWFIIKYFDSNKKLFLFISGISFFLGFLSKENTITFLGIIPLSVYFIYFKDDKKTILKKISASLIVIIPVTLIYLLVRYAVLGGFSAKIADELMNNPFLYATISEKYATIFYTLLLYIKLLVFPHPLTFDYYPFHIEIVSWTNVAAISGLLLYVAMGVYALVTIKQKNSIAYGFLIYLMSISIVSNLFFPVGTFMNERFVFIASLGFCIILAYLILKYIPKLLKNNAKTAVISILSLLFLLYSAKTISRNTVWKDDLTLFRNDVKISDNSAKVHTSLCATLIEKSDNIENQEERIKMLEEALSHGHRALEIYKNSVAARELLGYGYWRLNKNYQKSATYYIEILRFNPQHPEALSNLMAVFSNVQDVKFKMQTYQTIYQFMPDNYRLNYEIGVLYARYFKDLDNGLKFMQQAIKINPNRKEAYKDIGVIWGFKGEYQKSIEALEIALKLDPNDADIYKNIGVNYRAIGNTQKATEYFKKAQSIKP